MIYQLWNYISSFVVMCSSSFFNAQQCLKVWEYMPPYIADLHRFYSQEPYYLEKYTLSTHEKTNKEGL